MSRPGTVSMARCRRAAFTLVELLVVVAIISLLIAILLPSLNGARQQGRAIQCSANMRSLMMATKMYADENRDFFPGVGLSHSGTGNDLEKSWVKQLAVNYGNQPEVAVCPSDRSPYWKEPQIVAGGEPQLRLTSYATNGYTALPIASVDGDDEYIYDRESRIRFPSTTIFWVELVEEGEFALTDHVHPEAWAFFGDPREAASNEMAIDRHLKKANYAMVDGHVERLPFEHTLRKAPDFQLFHPSFLFNKYDPAIGR